MVSLPIQFALPVGEAGGANTPARLPGDPGSQEILNRPDHAYVFIVFSYRGSNTADIRFHEEDVSADSKWYDLMIDPTSGDYIYVSKLQYDELLMPLGKYEAVHVYAAMSKEPLTLYIGQGTTQVVQATPSTWPTTLEEVQNLTFVVDGDMQSKIQDVYSTPLGHEKDGHYYGDLNIWDENFAPVQMMLYHVASKVDLMWNVEDDVQSKLQVKERKVKDLFEGKSYLFKSTDNPNKGTGYTRTLNTDNAGMWWAGRDYFYTIPYQSAAGKYSLYVDMTLNNKSGSGAANPVCQVTQTGDMPKDFAPWIRGQFTFSQAITGNQVYSN